MKSIKMLLLASFMIMLTACGGSSSVDTSADAPKTIAINKIMTYSEDQTQPVPTIKDYADAGVKGVAADNLNDINARVSTLTKSDVDTVEKIQAILDDIVLTGDAPVITLEGANPYIIEVHSVYTDPGASATDTEDGTVSVSNDSATALDTATLGDQTVTYTATDLQDNTAQATRTVTVKDTTAPVIAITGNATINLLLNGTYAEPGVSCTDNYDATCTVVTGGATVDTTTPGNYIVTYGATDAAGNVATQVTRTVSVLLVQESRLLSAGDRHTVEIKADGTLWAYGYNNHGELGLGDTADRNTPIQVGSANNWVSVSTGGDSSEFRPHNDLNASGYTVAINSVGELWAWGDNTYGQLGDGTTGSHTTPNQVGADGDWVSVTAGDHHTIAIKSNGTLWAWGRNNHGQIGNGTTGANVLYPVQITAAGNGWVSVSAGGGDDTSSYAHSSGHSVAIKADGTLWAWGHNDYGQLGLGDTISRNVPEQVGGESDWSGVSVGDSHTLAIKASGTLWSWGWNRFGQLGIGGMRDTDVHSTPVQIGTAYKWVSVSVGGFHTLAIRDDNTLWSWGDNKYGQLGNVTTLSERLPNDYWPIQVGTESDWKSVNAGGFHTLATRSNNTLWVWGDNEYGQLGNGMITENKYVPIQESDDQNWSSVSGGGNHTVAIKNNNELWTWGYNYWGQHASGNRLHVTTTPIQVDSISSWLSLTTGFEYTAAIRDDYTLWTWGSNNYGQLGDGTREPYLAWLVQVGVDGDWASVASGGWHTVAIKTTGTLWTWGRNHFGQLGHGTISGHNSTPAQVGTDGDWSRAGSSDFHTVAIKISGTLWAWGANTYGQLGDGTTDSNSTPEQIGTDSWLSVSASDYHTVAIRADDTLWAWGWNTYGQLGDGLTANHSSPVQIGTDTWLDVSTGDYHTVAIKADGTLWAWGRNVDGQLGLGDTSDRHAPVQIGTASNWVSVSGGDGFSVAINSNYELWAWGDNDYGQVYEWAIEPQLRP